MSLQKAREVCGVVANPETLEVDSVESDRLWGIRNAAGNSLKHWLNTAACVFLIIAKSINQEAIEDSQNLFESRYRRNIMGRPTLHRAHDRNWLGLYPGRRYLLQSS